MKIGPMLLTVLAAMAVGGCAPMAPIKPANPYVSADYDYHRAAGPNTVTGQAFLRQQGGGLVTCAGTSAGLFPLSPYFLEVLTIHARGQQSERAAPGPSAVTGSPVKVAICDAQGNFSIPNVPAGDWILAADVRWVVGGSRQGGSLQQVVRVVDGGTNRFILSDNDRK